MDCDGDCGGSDRVDWYWYDTDGDGIGEANAGYYCSKDDAVTDGDVALTYGDFDADCACTAEQGNTLADCIDCRGNCIDDDAYIGNDAGLTYACTTIDNRKGCDVCDVCNGPGYTLYLDADDDGLGTGALAACTNTNGYIDNDDDLNDECHCQENTIESLSTGGSCVDECGVCGGDGYADSCTNLSYVIQYYDSTRTCVSMDCDGDCTISGGGTGVDTVAYYYHDNDGDNWGKVNEGNLCSSNADGLSTIYGDVNDDIFCESNILDACDLCDGSNEDKSYCENASFVDQVGCETAGSIWNTFFDGPEVDCFGTCNAVDSLQAATDECSSVSQPKCCGGNTGIECSYYIDTNNFGGDYDCLGECNGASIVDECGVCNGNSNLDAKGNCIFLLYPGDTDMDGSVNLNDINPIVKFWGRLVDQRTNFDVDGNILSSKSNWFAQSHSILGDRGKIAERECILYADANGDGRVNISDITTIIKNLNKSHSSPTSTDCSALSRTSDVEMYFSIFKSLPNGELKRSMADMYGFEMPPESFFVHPNYPNPFNPITTIKYEVPDKGSVLIAVFNLRGQRIHEYTNVVNSPGSYLMTWDASNYSTGIYYSSVYYNGELIENMKMIYLK